MAAEEPYKAEVSAKRGGKSPLSVKKVTIHVKALVYIRPLAAYSNITNECQASQSISNFSSCGVIGQCSGQLSMIHKRPTSWESVPS